MGHKLPLDEHHLDRLLVKKGGLYKFVELAWSEIDSEPFVGGWHLEELCLHLEAVSNGTIDRLLVNVPPGTGKSITVCVFWPVWDWLVNPDRRWMFASFDATLTQRDALRAKELINSDWFQERWGLKADPRKLARLGLEPLHVLTESKDRQNSASIYWSAGGGLRFSTSVGAKATGWHAHIQVVDDPIKPKDVEGGGKQARAACERAWSWYTGTMASRKIPGKFARVVIMQRLHQADLAGKLVKQGGYVHLKLPMEYNPAKPCVTPIGGDRRTEPGELLHPKRYTREVVDKTKEEMGPRVAAAQLDQEPTPDGGAIFQRAWMNKRWKELPARITLIQSWDCAFKDDDTSDYVVGQVWGKRGAEFYLVDEVRGQMDLPTTCQAMKDLSKKWPKAHAKLVEDKANGPAVEQTLRKKVPGIILVTPEGGKVSRANAASVPFEAGNVWLPDEHWVGDYVEELVTFPMGAHDDRVDATSQALLRFITRRSRLREAMDKVTSS